ncbi:MAG: cytochrome P450 [Myxococcota bacterium]
MPRDVDPSAVNLFDPEVVRCPHETFARLRSECPVGRMAITHSPVVARYQDVAWGLRHPEIFSSEMEMQMALGTDRPMIPQQIDPPAQTRYRKLLDPHFSRRNMEALAPKIRAHANQLIDGFIERGACEFDEAFAIPLPCTAFLHLLGLPDSDLALFLELKDGIIRPNKDEPSMSMDAANEVRAATGRRIYEYFERTLDDRERSPRDDLLTSLMTVELEGEKLSRTEILDICFLLLLAGLDTVTATLGCNMAYLAANPEQRARVLDTPELIPGAVEELLRWETPVMAVPRIAKQDVTIGDFQIRAGEMVTFLLGSANTDEEHFERAGEVDFERERNIHTAFGVGPHRCLGSHLARMELRVAMEEWHRRIPHYRVAEGETPRYSPGIREVLYLPLTWER